MFRLGIIGAGWIAEKMAQAIAPTKDIEINAIASRSIEYEHSMLALEHGKPVLVEKAFTANATQAEKLIQTARDKGLIQQ